VEPYGYHLSKDISHKCLCCISLTSGTPSGTPSGRPSETSRETCVIYILIMISGFKIVAKEHLLSPPKKTPAIDIDVKPVNTICL